MNKPSKEESTISQESLLKLAEVSILLSSYNDIFSDFDPSPFSERALSDDFITQIKKFVKNTRDKTSIKLLLPQAARNEADEKVIIKRLHAFFRDAHNNAKAEIRKTNRRGLILTMLGVVMMIIASYLSFIKSTKYPIHLMLVLFEPAGWFLLWTGLDHLLYFSRNSRKDYDFYLKMARADIRFLSY